MPARVVLGVGGGHRRVQGVRAAAAADRVRASRSGSCRPRTRCGSSARPPGPRCPASPVHHRRVGTTCHEVPHVRIGQAADLVVVAPATADLLARAAAGLADDLLTTTLLTARCPVRVRARPCTPRCGSTRPPRPTSRRCARRGAIVLEPAVGRLTGADTGTGRLPEPGRDLRRRRPGARPRRRRARRPTWPAAGWWSPPAAPGRHSTRSASSATGPPGRQGYALARAAVARGAEVTLVAANVALPDPAGAKVVRVVSAGRAARRRCWPPPATPTRW